MRKYFPGFVLILLVVIGFALAGMGSGAVQAQEALYDTPEQAFLGVLGEYMGIVRDDAAWQIGEIKQSGGYAYSIAQAGESVSEYQGFIMLLARKDQDGKWSAVAPKVATNVVYNQWLAEVPNDLLGPFGKSYYHLYDELAISASSPRAVPLHRFPWPINFQAVLTQKDGSYHTNQLDFVMRVTNDIYASKPGLVVFIKDSSSIGGCDMDLWPWANFVVVQHSATEFSWYVHLKYGSATVNVGDLIGYGTKIGEQGNTGFSCGTTGIHLHFMMSNAIPSSWPNPDVPNYAPWPPSGSIYPTDFVESTYASLVVGNYYVSQNASPPGVCNTAPAQSSFFDNTYCNSNLYSTSSSGFVDMVTLGISARLESIEIPAGWSVGLYLDQNELGAKTCLNASDSMLWDNLFSNGERVANNVMWARLYSVPGCPYPFEQGIAFYPEANFVGTPLWGMVGERSSNEPGTNVGSIYLPDGYSAVIYDQDDLAGNSLCLSGSVLDLSSEPGWPGQPVESVSLIYGDSCETEPNPVPVPVLVSPKDGAAVYTDSPELCWQLSEPGHSFNVQIFGDGYDDASGWIEETCWSPPNLTGRTGTHTWRVQAKNSLNQIGPWSNIFDFTITEDTKPPTAQFLYLKQGSSVVRPRSYLEVAAQDGESGVARVHFFAWYDDGSTGYDWRYLGSDEDGTDGWKIIWNLTDVQSADAAAWSYVEDKVGNFSSVFLSGLLVVNSLPNASGYEGRDSSGSGESEAPSTPEEGSTGELEGTAPEGQPEVEESPPANQPATSPPLPVTVEEVTVPTALPSTPAVVSPVLNETYYQPGNVKLCWEAGSQNTKLTYKIEISGDVEISSSWIDDNCWQPLGLASGSGSYSWRVKARKAGVGMSDWSEWGAFQLAADKVAPTVIFESPQSSKSFTDEVVMQISATDDESGLRQAHILAWYDDGAGAQWHEIGKESISTGAIDFRWDVSGITPQKVQLWVYVEDLSGNLGFAMVPEIFLSTPAVNQPETSRYEKALRDTVTMNRIGD